MLWTDCDREGEYIGYEIMQVVKQKRPNIKVLRARFSALIPADIRRCAQQLGPLNMRETEVRMYRRSDSAPWHAYSYRDVRWIVHCSFVQLLQAVSTRSELDLRLGCVFTRFQVH